MAAGTDVKHPMGLRLRQARTDADLSLDRLGEIVGTGRRHLIKLEQGEHRPRPALLARIAEATGKPVEWFTEGEDG